MLYVITSGLFWFGVIVGPFVGMMWGVFAMRNALRIDKIRKGELSYTEDLKAKIKDENDGPEKAS